MLELCVTHKKKEKEKGNNLVLFCHKKKNHKRFIVNFKENFF